MGTMGIFMAMFFVLFGIAFVTILVLIISAALVAIFGPLSMIRYRRR